MNGLRVYKTKVLVVKEYDSIYQICRIDNSNVVASIHKIKIDGMKQANLHYVSHVAREMSNLGYGS